MVEPHLHDDVALQLFEPRGAAAVEVAVQGLPGGAYTPMYSSATPI
jgi:hypothetical protein